MESFLLLFHSNHIVFITHTKNGTLHKKCMLVIVHRHRHTRVNHSNSILTNINYKLHNLTVFIQSNQHFILYYLLQNWHQKVIFQKKNKIRTNKRTTKHFNTAANRNIIAFCCLAVCAFVFLFLFLLSLSSLLLLLMLGSVLYYTFLYIFRVFAFSIVAKHLTYKCSGQQIHRYSAK